MPAAQDIYRRLVQSDSAAEDVAEEARPHVARNGLRQIAANGLQSTGDQVVNAKTVLPWLLVSVGAPGALIGLLVPIRESGSMLPQAPMAPWVERHRLRKWIWVGGGAGQAVATAAMSLLAATASGVAAGVGILLALAVFSLSRSLTSLTGKDVLGRTVPKGQRGQINGTTTVLSGVVAIAVGLGIRLLAGDDVATGVLAGLLGAAALAWVVALAVYATILEPAGEPSAVARSGPGWASWAWALLRRDVAFRRFVTVRTLLLVSALSPPFVVAFAAARGGVGLGALGPFIVAQGVANMLGGRFFGQLADRSSRRLMIGTGAASSASIALFLALLAVPAARNSEWLYPAVYLLLALSHTGVRVARKTYVVDMADGDQRTEYVAVANTAMGVLLLATGAVSSALAGLGNEIALGFLAALGFLGAAIGRTLPEVSRQ